jgi:hypothetical protein
MLAQYLLMEPPLLSVLLGYGSLGIFGFLLCRFRSTFFYLVLPFILAIALPLILELHDPVVGPGLRAESPGYYLQAHVAILFAFIAPYFGALRHAESGERFS